MKILLANYRYFVSGGPERYMFNVKAGLEQRGHEIIPFSIHYSKNEPTPYSRYFVQPLAGPDAIRFDEHAWSLRSFLKTVERSFYSPEVAQAVGHLVDDAKPDVAYILHFLRKLSPSLLVGIKKRGIPIVVRISDFLLMCPAIHLLRDGKPCELCLRGDLKPSVKYRCVKGSLGASLVSYLSMHFHRWRGYFDLIDRFVITNEFTLSKMIEAGWPREKLVHIPTFVAPRFFDTPAVVGSAPPYILYVGHLEPHKGIETLLRAYSKLKNPPKLILAASMDTAFAAEYRTLSKDLGVAANVDFRGFVAAEDLAALYRGALFTVLPSICYENMPNAVIESMACGTPVLGSGHGSVGALIEDGRTGRIFRPGDVDDLSAKMANMIDDPTWLKAVGQRAREKAEQCYKRETHLELLLNTLSSVQNRYTLKM
ncbi:MAG TPA: glycosyltransferase family 4 protein [Kiritimatiellia bacterium]|nr:glycosyltransferase family 4 protein [Kiritimatiellia bacterium]